MTYHFFIVFSNRNPISYSFFYFSVSIFHLLILPSRLDRSRNCLGKIYKPCWVPTSSLPSSEAVKIPSPEGIMVLIFHLLIGTLDFPKFSSTSLNFQSLKTYLNNAKITKPQITPIKIAVIIYISHPLLSSNAILFAFSASLANSMSSWVGCSLRSTFIKV